MASAGSAAGKLNECGCPEPQYGDSYLAMKVCVSVKGRFHAFDLARELQQLGVLERLITSYPAFAAERFGVDPAKVTAIPAHEILDRLWARVPGRIRGPLERQLLVQERLHDFFDWRVSRILPHDMDVFVGWASLSLRSLRRAKALGAKTIVERGSSHVQFQENILKEEYERAGLRYEGRPRHAIDRDLMEYAEADYISIPSSFVRRTFLTYGVPENKLIQVPYGVNLSGFKPMGKSDDVFRVIHCGALSLRKGVHYLLQAFHELKLPNTELWLVGALTAEIRPYLSRFGSPNVHHIGPFPQHELPRYYSQGSVFCLASVEEGLAMVQPQAMACGLPVICTTNTGGEDLVRDGVDGFVVPIRSIDALKEKLELLYANSQLTVCMGDAARQRALQKFSWGKYGATMLDRYLGVAGVRVARD